MSAPAVEAAVTRQQRLGPDAGKASAPTLISLTASSAATLAPRSSPAPATLRELAPAPAAGSPPKYQTRKRAASINIEEANHARLQHLSLNTASTVSAASTASPHPSGGLRDLICLCTPAPKVPRPRNAFILYRQHHQGQVVAQNPGLANPEISKIIGEKWRDEPEDDKNQWKRLAEEEKQRHSRQYPDYRYQPRRSKGQANRPTLTSGEDPGRCLKCGGRYIATARAPSTPLMTPTASRNTMPSYMHPAQRLMGMEHRQPQQQAVGPAGHHAGRMYAHHGYADMQDEYDMISESPSECKRRRFNAAGNYQSLAPLTPYGVQQQYARQQMRPSVSGPGSGAYISSAGPGPLPGPAMIGRQTQAMGPPPRPFEGTTGRGGFDESLRLPPLQTQQLPATSPPTAATQAGTAGPGMDKVRESQGRSVEAMVMSIPYVNKLRVLEKISPAISRPGPGSAALETRGPVIALEGANPALLARVARVVEKALQASEEVEVRVWSSSSDGAMGAQSMQSQRPIVGSGSGSPFVAYLQTIMQWHAHSAEIVKFVTSHPSATSSPQPKRRGLSDASSTISDMSSGGLAKSDDTSRGRPTLGPTLGPTVAPTVAPPLQPPKQVSPHMPVALLIGGFSLTISDRFASSVPISDSYAPVDHWQWMATLWRGIVGPDLVVYVRAAAEEEMVRHNLQAVEIKMAGLMMVRASESAMTKASGGLGESTERRLAFEIVEWVRAGSFRRGLEHGE